MPSPTPSCAAGGPTGASGRRRCSRASCASSAPCSAGRRRGPSPCSTPTWPSEIEWAKARLVPARAVRGRGRRGPGRTPPLPPSVMAAVYEQYEAEKRRKGVVDFDDLLSMCARALDTDDEFAAAQRWRFRHLFVDEFQDVNPVQFRLLKGWLGDRARPVRRGRPQPGDLLVERRRPPAAARASTGCSRRATTSGSTTTTAPRPRCWRWPTPCSPPTGAVGAGPAWRPTGPTGRCRSCGRYATDIAEAHGVAAAIRRHARAEPSVVATGRARAHQRPGRRVRAGVPGGARSRSGCGAVARCSRQPEVQAGAGRARGVAGAGAVRPAGSPSSKGWSGPAERPEERRENLEALVGLAKEYAALDHAGALGVRLRRLAGGDGEAATSREYGGDVVEIVTFHRAKGLEWPVVFVTGPREGARADRPRRGRRRRGRGAAAAVRGAHPGPRRAALLVGRAAAVLGHAGAPVAVAVAGHDRGGDPGAGGRGADRRLAALPRRPSGRRLRSVDGGGRIAGRRPPCRCWATTPTRRCWRPSRRGGRGRPGGRRPALRDLPRHHAGRGGRAAAHRPGALLSVPGLGPVKAARYGDALLALVAEHGHPA